MNLKSRHKGILLALIGVLFITPDSLSIRLVNINSWELMFYRGLIPFICLLTLLLFVYKKNFIKVCLAIGYAGILNALLVALGNITFVTSLENTNVANTLIMISLAPFMAAIFSSIFLKEYPNRRTWITMLLCFIFVIYIFYDSYESQKLLGDIFGFATAIIIGASSVVIRYGKLTNFLPSLMLGKFFTMLITIFFVNSLIMESSDIFLIFVMGIFFVFIPISLITLAPRYIAAHEVELFFVLETALGPIWVWYFINERPTDKTIIGGVFIIFIIFIYTILELREKKKLVI
jgi:drug/metabolite transporter (DMT)-like permease